MDQLFWYHYLFQYQWVRGVLHVQTVLYQHSADYSFEDTCLDSVVAQSVIGSGHKTRHCMRSNPCVQELNHQKSFCSRDNTYKSILFLIVRMSTPTQQMFTIQNWCYATQICSYGSWTEFFYKNSLVPDNFDNFLLQEKQNWTLAISRSHDPLELGAGYKYQGRNNCENELETFCTSTEKSFNLIARANPNTPTNKKKKS